MLLGEKKQTKDSETLRGTLQKTDDSCVNFVEGVSIQKHSQAHTFKFLKERQNVEQNLL